MDAKEKGMSKEEIEEGNKLIAWFMGDYDLYHWDRDPFNEFHKAMYHSSWDALMPVVEKIETMDYGFRMCRKVVEVYIDSTKSNILYIKKSCRMESLYYAVVAFIKMYSM